MRVLLIPIFFYVILLSRSTWAFVESYSLFGPLESKRINGPKHLDSEYYSDVLAYQNPMKTDYRFLNANNAYDIYVGSISSKQFAIQQRLKLNQKISENFYFDLIYVEKENFEEGREQFMSGLSYKLSKAVSLSAYTSLFSSKDQNDVGLALSLDLNQTHKVRFFLNMIDFGFSERNEIEAEDQKKPLHFGLYGRWLSDNSQFFEYYFFRNSSIVRDFTQTDQRYVFAETRLGLRGKYKLFENYDYNFDHNFFQGKEGQYQIIAPDFNNDTNWARTGFRSLHQIESGPMIAGIQYNYRYWSSDAGSVQHSNIMPHVWYNIRLYDTAVLPKSIDLGLEASFHQAQGDERLRSSTDIDSDINSRFNLRLCYEFSKSAVLNLLFSSDLDDKFSWEGGGGQFQIYF